MRTLLAVACSVTALLGMRGVGASVPDATQRLQTDTFSQTTDLGALSPGVRLALTRFLGDGTIANRGDPFEASDVTRRASANVPRRRLIRAGTSGDLTFVEYEHGGLGLHQHLVLFQTRGSEITMLKACSGLLPLRWKQLRVVAGTSECPWQSSEH
jgi:hypothetical protein